MTDTLSAHGNGAGNDTAAHHRAAIEMRVEVADRAPPAQAQQPKP